MQKPFEQNKVNYQKQLDAILAALPTQAAPCRLLLHACCAPCASYVLEYLSAYFAIDVVFYNPNITPQDEYEKRRDELVRLIALLPARYPIKLLQAPYCPADFAAMAKGMEQLPEGGERCFACYGQRLRYTAALAAKGGYDYFCTTLSISPLKNARKINEIGTALAKQYGTAFLPSDFKKREGYKRSIVLSELYGLYRQNFCGCEWSKPTD